MKSIIDKVHKHVCGHSTFTDIKTLLQRNDFWSEDAKKYLAETLEKCPSCLTTSLPKKSRKVALSAMSRDFNDVVCLDHFFLDDFKVFHVMDSSTRFSVGSVVPDTTMNSAIIAFETHWISPFWAPNAEIYDPAFKNDLMESYLKNNGIEGRPLPPRRHSKIRLNPNTGL